MVRRALSVATVMLWTGCLASGAAHAQATNLEAGKTPSQIFAGTCSACHKSPRGLAKTVGPAALPGFLRQHYTTSSDMASVLSSYLVSNGAADPRFQGGPPQAKQGREGRQQDVTRPGALPEQLDRPGRRTQPAAASQEGPRPDVQQSARPDADGLGAQGEPVRRGRNGKRVARPAEPGINAANPAEPAAESRTGRHKRGKRGRPGEEMPKADAKPAEVVKPVEPPKSEPAREDAAKDAAKDAKEVSKPEPAKSEAAKPEPDKSDAVRAAPDNKPDGVKVDTPKQVDSGDGVPTRPAPVAPVTAPPSAASPSSSPPSATPEPAANPSPPAATPPAAASAPPAQTSVTPPPPPAAPAGGPEPPTSK